LRNASSSYIKYVSLCAREFVEISAEEEKYGIPEWQKVRWHLLLGDQFPAGHRPFFMERVSLSMRRASCYRIVIF
jgi:hypothetical protein